jgi:hypothetical protein
MVLPRPSMVSNKMISNHNKRLVNKWLPHPLTRDTLVYYILIALFLIMTVSVC